MSKQEQLAQARHCAAVAAARIGVQLRRVADRRPGSWAHEYCVRSVADWRASLAYWRMRIRQINAE